MPWSNWPSLLNKKIQYCLVYIDDVQNFHSSDLELEVSSLFSKWKIEVFEHFFLKKNNSACKICPLWIIHYLDIIPRRAHFFNWFYDFLFLSLKYLYGHRSVFNCLFNVITPLYRPASSCVLILLFHRNG